jgi:hypothetical protein
MSESSLLELIVLCSAAGGLVLLGLCRLFLANQSRSLRYAAAIGFGILATAGPLLAGYSTAALVPFTCVSVASLILAALASPRLARAVATGLRHFGKSEFQAAFLSALGGTLLVASIVRFERGERDALDRDLAFMDEVTSRPPLTASKTLQVTTDAGRAITVWDATINRTAQQATATEHRMLADFGLGERLIRTGPASEVTNCHGWVFAAGEHWISNDDVELILADNGYRAISQPQTGDLAIYRQNGKVVHSAIVRTLAENGSTLVESKWGWMGSFIHLANDSCYGQSITYYRAPRVGHTLAGIDSKSHGQDVASTP